MRPEALVRGVAKGIVVLCLAGGVVAADCHDWSDTMLIGLLGAFSVVTARKMTWKLRLGRDADTTHSASAGFGRIDGWRMRQSNLDNDSL